MTDTSHVTLNNNNNMNLSSFRPFSGVNNRPPVMNSTPIKGKHPPAQHATAPTIPSPRTPSMTSQGFVNGLMVQTSPHNQQSDQHVRARGWRPKTPTPGKGLDTSWLQGAATPSADARKKDGVLPMGIGGWTPPKHVAPLHKEVVQQEQQLHAYIAWVNSQLKRKPGTRLVDDLRSDMQDGVALLDLIEVVAGEQLTGVYPVPSNTQEMRENVERVLQFMSAKRIRMHRITAKDIVDGNLKSIMRLILALAAHFKPSSVKHHNSSTSRQHSFTSIAQGAAAALADARCDAASVGQRIRRPRRGSLETRVFGSGPDSDHSGGSDHSGQRSYYGKDGSGQHLSHRVTDAGVQRVSQSIESLPKSKSQDFELGLTPTPAPLQISASDIVVSADAWNKLTTDHNTLLDDFQVTKKALLRLQDLLLGCTSSDDQEDIEQPVEFEGATPAEDVVILKSRLQQMGGVCGDLREELSRSKNEVMQLQGTKAGLQKRLSEQEEAFLKLKAELLRVGFTQQSLESEKAELQRKLNEKEKLVIELKKDAVRKDKQLEEVANEFHSHLHEKESSTHSMRSQIESLHERLCKAGHTESNLSARIASQDRKMQILEGRLGSGGHDSNSSRTSSLRSYNGTEATSPRRLNYDSTGDVRRSPITSLHSHPLHSMEAGESSGHMESTKVLYFTDRTVTPFMCTLPKRLGEIRLHDLKQIFDRSGLYRYHFKALDPEFGTVKEEISNDDAIIPGWEGKIVAWIEEDQG